MLFLSRPSVIALFSLIPDKIYLHFVYDLQKYLCLQVNGLRELGSLKLIQTQGKAILLLILFDSLQKSCLGQPRQLGFQIFSLSAPYNRISENNQSVVRFILVLTTCWGSFVLRFTSDNRSMCSDTLKKLPVLVGPFNSTNDQLEANEQQESAWGTGYGAGLDIWTSRLQVPLRPLS